MMKQVQFESRGETMYGFAHVPESAAGKRSPAIILCHGFTGSCFEDSRLFVHLARAAEARGFYVLRSDFVGSGNSDASFSEHTYLSGWVKDICSSLDFLQRQPEVDPDRIGVLGISFGAGAALTAGCDDRVKAVVGWASVIEPEAVFRGIFGDRNWDFMEQRKTQKISQIYSGTRFSVTDRFVRDAHAFSIAECVCSYQDTALMLVQGDADTVVDPSHAKALAERVPFDIEYIAIPDEEHTFHIHEKENIETAITFFKRVL